MKAQPILLGVAIAGIAASIGCVSAVDRRVSPNTSPSEVEAPHVTSRSDSSDLDSELDIAEPTDAPSESSLQSDPPTESTSNESASERTSNISVARTPAVEPEFDASTGDNSIAALPSCSDAITQTDMNICAHQAYETVDVALNQTYQALTQELSATEQELLIDAELAWIEYRDKTCEAEAAPYEGGSIQPLIYSQCLTRLTENRTAELQARLDEVNSR